MADVRLLPHDDQAEMSVLASILVEVEAKSTDSLKHIREALPPEDCRRTAHKKIIATYIKHFDEDLPTDLEDIASPSKRDEARDDFEGYLKEIRGEHPAMAMESALLTGKQIFEAFKMGLQSSHLIEDIWPETACCGAGCAEPKVLREILRRELDELYDLSNMDSEAQAEIKERQ
jgi:hypothetical protein